MSLTAEERRLRKRLSLFSSERVSTFVVESQEIQADHKNGKENIP